MTCSKCDTVLSRKTVTGLCAIHSREAQAAERTKLRFCVTCTKPITRYSKSGRCTECLAAMGKWMKERTALLARDAIRDLKNQARAEWPALAHPVVTEGDDDLMLEIQIVDLHMGKLAWAEETGEANYNAEIAERLYKDAFTAILSRVVGYKFGRIALVVGSDGLHSDTKQGTTTAGTVLDTDSRYHKNFRRLQRCVVWATQLAATQAPRVDVYAIPGNHDALSAWHLGNALELFFKDSPSVTVHNAVRGRQYCEHGKVMLMFTHGNQGKLERYPNLMAEDEPEMWGRTQHREAHTGDKHQTSVREIMGTRVRICPALCPADAWHADKHFLYNKRAAEAFIWDANDGLIGTAVYTVPK